MKRASNKGFTLIEMVIYIVLIAFIVTIFNGFIKDVVFGSVKVNSVREVNQNNRLIMNMLVQNIKTAKQITSAIPSAGTSSIILINSSNQVIRFFLAASTGIVYINDGIGNIALSNNSVTVTQLRFEQYGNTININLKLEERKPKNISTPYHLDTFLMVVPRKNIY